MTQSNKEVLFFYIVLIFVALISCLVYNMAKDSKPAIRFCGYIIGLIANFIVLWITLYFYFGLNLLSLF